ncbi:efflux transporter outer membrane subunit [Botrimarina mediterranea]|uniref:Toluene efflux pump outer membrane protein TtgI n=1 Tax=Botrimarina mediterranea TaxID=2528022 RepID=A0A518KAI8_9BACT|nr:efflux transporter outer membrane subunit [Botrimarina mediterranea]QDV74806.1 Toluene efflux pump outer membrane protein TtgI precursor [Botrimarina mediterranea]QDV79450.1 Toluene efflux pump outer membrane protein TtgI precursor [Planctomycetes bacterium K2D]
MHHNKYPSSRYSTPRRLRRCACLAVAAVAVGGSSGCMTSFKEYVHNGFKVGPNYCKPAVPVSDEWVEARDTRLSSEPVDLRDWWGVFNDPCLDELIRISYAENLTVRDAGYRVLEARALRQVAVGGLFPQQQQATGSYTRTQISDESGFGGAGFGGGQIDIWQLGGQLAWELDFWGRFRRAIESANAELDASVEAYDDVLVILVSDVASTYVEIRTLQQRIAYAEQNVESQSGSLRIATDLFEGGAAGKLDVTQAQTNLSQTEALIPQLRLQLRQATNRLCVLMGRPPEDLSPLLAMSPAKIPTSPKQVVAGIPAELVRRRPDVRQAERLVAQQSARIGIAEADLYPAFSITGNLGWQAPTFNRMFQTSAFTGSISPGFTWNILNYGRLRANVAAQDALFQQRVAQYQQTVLEAHREAEDAIAAFLRYQEQAEALTKSADAALESSDLVQQLYKGGQTDFGRVFVAELALVNQQDAKAVAEGQIAQGLVDIYRSLGGGWQVRLGGPTRLPVVIPAEDAESVPTPLPAEETPAEEAPSEVTPEEAKEPTINLPVFAAK